MQIPARELMRTSLIHTQSAIGEGTSVLGDGRIGPAPARRDFGWTTCSGRRCCGTIDLRANVGRFLQVRNQARARQSEQTLQSIWTTCGPLGSGQRARAPGLDVRLFVQAPWVRGLNNDDAPMPSVINLLLTGGVRNCAGRRCSTCPAPMPHRDRGRAGPVAGHDVLRERTPLELLTTPTVDIDPPTRWRPRYRRPRTYTWQPAIRPAWSIGTIRSPERGVLQHDRHRRGGPLSASRSARVPGSGLPAR